MIRHAFHQTKLVIIGQADPVSVDKSAEFDVILQNKYSAMAITNFSSCVFYAVS